MAHFTNLMHKLRLRQPVDEPNSAKQKAVSYSPEAECSRRAEPPVTSDTMSTPQTNLNYVQTQWVDNSIVADVADASDSRRSPDGPDRIHDNFVVREIDTDWSSTQHSVYYMENGRFNQSEVRRDVAGDANTTLPENSKRYNPAYCRQSQEDWRARAARNLRGMSGTGSLRSFSADHLQDRHYFQSRIHDPWEALGAASQQAQIELRALKLESDALSLSSTATQREAAEMEDDIESLTMKILAIKAQIQQMTERIDVHTVQKEMSTVPSS